MAPARIGLGGGALGTMSDRDAFRLLDAARDVGVLTIDVARSYGDAEARVGRWRRDARASDARARTDRFEVITKGGYGVDGVEDWTGEAVARCIAESRARLAKDQLDVFLLHSCGAHVLARDDVRDALHAALDAGHVAHVGYSGDEDDLHVALDRAPALRLSVIEQSLSLLDGRARIHTLPRARALGMRVIAKRALANAPWMFMQPAPGEHRTRHADEQRARFVRAALPDVGLAWDELFVRYAAHHTPGVDVVLTGTARADRLAQLVAHVERGPLATDLLAALAPALARCDQRALV